MERIRVPAEVSADDLHPTPARAAERRAEEAGLANPRAERFSLIFADEDIVDLRVRVTTDDDCRWFGVVGMVEHDAIRWYAGAEGSPCGQ